MEILRQGNICFVRLSKLPEGAEPTGETFLEVTSETGHPHVIEGVRVFKCPPAPFSVEGPVPMNRVAIIEVAEGTLSTTADHPELPIPLGLWEVLRATEEVPRGVGTEVQTRPDRRFID